MSRYARPITFLLWVGVLFLAFHWIGDTSNSGEPADWRVSIAQFFLYLGAMSLIFPRLDSYMAQRPNSLGLGAAPIIPLQAAWHTHARAAASLLPSSLSD